MTDAQRLRDRITHAVTDALRPLPGVLAGWEGGSAAFAALDQYSDIDLTYLVDDAEPFENLYPIAEKAIESVSPITVRYNPPLGRYYKLRDGGDYLLVDLVFLHAGGPDNYLDVERHGHVISLFDKADWLRQRRLDNRALASQRKARFRELQLWFVVSQSFVRKAILRQKEIEAIAAFWSYTIKPLTELLRMRHSSVRWDFGLRYLDRDVPPVVYDELRKLMFVQNLDDLETKLATATRWGAELLRELGESTK